MKKVDTMNKEMGNVSREMETLEKSEENARNLQQCNRLRMTLKGSSADQALLCSSMVLFEGGHLFMDMQTQEQLLNSIRRNCN